MNPRLCMLRGWSAVIVSLLAAGGACVTTQDATPGALLHPATWYGEAPTDELLLGARETDARRAKSDSCLMPSCFACTVTHNSNYEVRFQSAEFCALSGFEQDARFSELCVRVFDRRAEFAGYAPGDVTLIVEDPTGARSDASYRCRAAAVERERASRKSWPPWRPGLTINK